MATPTKIDRVTQGQTPSLIEAAKANELIDALNRLLSIEVRVTATGSSRFVYSQGKIILQISKAEITS